MSLQSLLLFGISSVSMYVAVRGCSCMTTSNRDQFCRAAFAIQGTVTDKSQVEDDSPDFFTTDISYDVTITNIYKRPTDVWFQKGEEVVIWTPSFDGLCGTSLELNTDYLITGSFDITGKMQIISCDWIVPTSSLDASHFKGLKGGYDCNGQQ